MRKRLVIENMGIAKQWHPSKNADVDVLKIAPNSHYKAWWICDEGHEYQAVVSHRTKRNDGCPFCSGKRPIINVNDFKTNFPNIAKEWDYDLNIKSPEEYLPYSHYKAVWICNKQRHRFRSTIADRTCKKVICPYCSGRYPIVGKTDLYSINPSLVEEWDYERNGNLKPQQFTSQSNIKVWWLCSICKKSWRAQINLRARGKGCPYCAIK